MSRLNKLKYSKNVSRKHRLLFSFLDLLIFNNSQGDCMLADYIPFKDWCFNELNKFGFDVDDIPKETNEGNWVTRYYKLENSIADLNTLKKMDYDQDLKLRFVRDTLVVDLVD